jgi:hypothetical protein
MRLKQYSLNINARLTMSPKQITLKTKRQLNASRGVSASAALNIPGPTGFPIFARIFL